ncbi:hypothetical protein ANCCEY_11043 [Ancylostoma ceylanicum]|uniref:Uncharacterized protein n=1 Tax=Ancylostoma ceylanicum TaxID=53326 RepID=A0A0D6LDC4_9BILA|nr:hypothetical protein ANCCEY_11043 [Ancylostoma ceylanicum]
MGQQHSGFVVEIASPRLGRFQQSTPCKDNNGKLSGIAEAVRRHCPICGDVSLSPERQRNVKSLLYESGNS